MNTWLNLAGHPIITVERNYVDDTIKISQKTFMPNSNTENNKWFVPINYATQKDFDFGNTKALTWLTPELDSMNLSVPIDPNEWIIFNNQQTGLIFYFTYLW